MPASQQRDHAPMHHINAIHGTFCPLCAFFVMVFLTAVGLETFAAAGIFTLGAVAIGTPLLARRSALLTYAFGSFTFWGGFSSRLLKHCRAAVGSKPSAASFTLSYMMLFPKTPLFSLPTPLRSTESKSPASGIWRGVCADICIGTARAAPLIMAPLIMAGGSGAPRYGLLGRSFLKPAVIYAVASFTSAFFSSQCFRTVKTF